MSEVFIAHVEEDGDVALEIALGLEEAGYRTWSYEVDSIPGPSYLLQTGQAVEQAKAIIVVISPHSLSSTQVTREVVRAHESGSKFVPVLRGVTHIEFQNRQPEWREAMGAAASISIPKEGITSILSRIISGLKFLGVHPRAKVDSTKIVHLRKALGERQGHGVSEKVAAPPVPAGKPEPEAVATMLPAAKAAGESWWRPKWKRLVAIASAIVVLVVVVVFFLTQAEEPAPAPTPTPSPTQEAQPAPEPTSTPAPALPPAPSPVPSPEPAAPEVPVKLIYETFLPNDNRLAASNTWFFNEASRLSGDDVEMEYRYGATQSADLSPLLEAVGGGDIDCSLIPIGAIPDLVPLSQGLRLDYLTYKPDTMALAAKSLYNTFTPLREEWEVDNNVKVLYALPLDTSVLCTTRPVPCVADLEGCKIGSWGRIIDTLERLGAVPVLIPPTDIYEAQKLGVIDGTLYGFDGISLYKLFEVSKYLTEPWIGPHGMYVTVINKDVWDSLPARVQEHMEGLSEEALARYLETLTEDNLKVIKEMVTAGVHFSLWSESEREIARKRVQPAQTQDWIDEVGANGQELIDRLQEELAVYEAQSTYRTGFEIWQEEYGEPGPKLLYEDGFSDPNSGWPKIADEAYEGYYEAGEYHILAKESCCAWIWRSVGPFKDFTLEVDARRISGPEQGGYGLIFRFKDSDNFYRFLVSEDSYYLVGKRTDGNWSRFQSKLKSAFIKEGTNHLKVVCQGSQLEMYVNGQRLTTITDNSFTEGIVGFIVDTPEDNTCVAFDNIKVYSID